GLNTRPISRARVRKSRPIQLTRATFTRGILDEETFVTQTKETQTDVPGIGPRSQDPGAVQTRPPQGSTITGRVETLSTDFVTGWASVSAANHFSHVFAMVGAEVIGFGVANIARPDLERARQESQLN